MRLGVSPYGSTRAEVLRFAAAALDAGFEALWLGDGIFRRPDFAGWRGGMESMTELAWLAGRFPEAAFGITAAVLPLRDVEWLAREAATLDHVTEGRFTLAVAAGFWADELTHRGVDPDRRGAELRARLAQLRSCWDGSLLSPPPATPGGPPVWLAGAVPTMRLALEVGLPFQSARATPEDLAPLAARWFDGGGGRLAHRTYLEAGAGFVAEQFDRHALVAGSAAELADGLAAYEALGVSDLSIVLGHDDASAWRALDLAAAALSAVR